MPVQTKHTGITPEQTAEASEYKTTPETIEIIGPILEAIIEESNVLVAELRELDEDGPHFRILHRFRAPGTDCVPGEAIAGVWLVHRGRDYHLKLSLQFLFDYLARHSRLPLSAAQIEAGIRADRFYRDPATAVTRVKQMTRRVSRSAVKV